MTNNNIYQKLRAVQKGIGPLNKSKRNDFGKYNYVDECQILTKLRPLLDTNGLTLTFDDVQGTYREQEIETKKGNREWRVSYEKRMIMTNIDNPTEQATFYFVTCGQNTDVAKAKGSAETYGVKYFLMKFLLIPVADNLDPDKFGEKNKEQPEKKELTVDERKTVDELLAKHNLVNPCNMCKNDFASMYLKPFGTMKLCESCFEKKRKEIYGNK